MTEWFYLFWQQSFEDSCSSNLLKEVFLLLDGKMGPQRDHTELCRMLGFMLLEFDFRSGAVYATLYCFSESSWFFHGQCVCLLSSPGSTSLFWTLSYSPSLDHLCCCWSDHLISLYFDCGLLDHGPFLHMFLFHLFTFVLVVIVLCLLDCSLSPSLEFWFKGDRRTSNMTFFGNFVARQHFRPLLRLPNQNQNQDFWCDYIPIGVWKAPWFYDFLLRHPGLCPVSLPLLLSCTPSGCILVKQRSWDSLLQFLMSSPLCIPGCLTPL